jgi:hypothetical protein
MPELPSLFRLTIQKHYYYSDVLEQPLSLEGGLSGTASVPLRGCGRGTWVRYGAAPRCLACAQAEGPRVEVSDYFFPWPHELEGLGGLAVGTFEHCTALKRPAIRRGHV